MIRTSARAVCAVVLAIATLAAPGRAAEAAKTTAGTVATTSSAVKPLGVGEKAPDLELRNSQGEPIRLGNVYSRKPTVLIFYRGGWCPYCTRHLSDLATVEKELVEAGFQLVAVSPDQPAKLQTGPTTSSLTLLSDSDAEAIKAFGLAFRLDDETVSRYLTFKKKIDLEEWSGRGHHILPVPAVYIVDSKGVIRFVHTDPNYRDRLSGEQVLKAARAVKE